MTTLAYTVPTPGTDLNAVADPEIASALNAIKAWANGSIDAVNLSALLAQSVGANQNAQVVKGATNIAASETRTNVAYGTMPTPDQVTGIVLPANGLIAVSYWATWQESVAFASRAAIFVGSNQLKVIGNASSPETQAAVQGGTTNTNNPLISHPSGLLSYLIGPYTGDVTTGQATGIVYNDGTGGTNMELGGSVVTAGSAVTLPVGGGWCLIDNLPAATYAISVQFKASSGSVTASNRRLRAMAISFS